MYPWTWCNSESEHGEWEMVWWQVVCHLQSKGGQPPPSLCCYLRSHTLSSTQSTTQEGPTSDRPLYLSPTHATDFKWWKWKFGACHTHSFLLFSFRDFSVVPCHGACASQRWRYKPATDSATEKSHMTRHRPSNILYYWRHRATTDYKHFQLVQ